jgi:hypothetical protein
MSRMTNTLAFAGLLALAAQLHAQTPSAPGPRPNRRPAPPAGARPLPGPGMIGRAGPDVAEQLLSHTGELKLSDQQVTRLAAIARRSADRRQAMRRTLDSLAEGRGPGRPDSTRARGAPPEMRAAADRMRDQAHGDLRDALAVLSPDQLATAWELVATRGPGPRVGAGFMGGPMGGGPGMRRGAGFRGGPRGMGSGTPAGPPPDGSVR